MTKERARAKEYFEKIEQLNDEHREEIYKWIDIHLKNQRLEEIEKKLHPERGQIINFK